MVISCRQMPKAPTRCSLVAGYGVVCARLSESNSDFKASLKNLFVTHGLRHGPQASSGTYI
jgi:hypothetical protein